MAPSEEISRAEWLAETQRLCPSDPAFDAYVALERFVVEKTPLLPTYRRNQHGKSQFATFSGSASGRCSVIQIYNGRCWLHWKWSPGKSGRPAKQVESVNRVFEELRLALDGSKTKSSEQIKVVRLGLDRVKAALLKASVDLVEALKDDSVSDRQKTESDA
jgi:hypothetical protein